ncbi:MAG TPA: hypothetical protein VIV58_30520 [Kofleriaceae bacterium]
MTHPQHIYAELSTERCDGLRDDLEARLELCSFDELRVMDKILGRLELGRARYGYLDLARDTRNYRREEAEEHLDGAVYRACDELDRADKERR